MLNMDNIPKVKKGDIAKVKGDIYMTDIGRLR
jgi:hypothetical protein